MTKLAAFAAAALLAGGVSMAAAQSSMSPSAPSSGTTSSGAATAQGQCWDVASKTIKNNLAAKCEVPDRILKHRKVLASGMHLE